MIESLAWSVLFGVLTTLSAPADSVVTCAPSQSALSPKDTVTLRVFADPPMSRASAVRWRVSAGRLLGTGPTVRWVLRDAGVGRYTASANVLRGTTVVATCSASVVVTPPVRTMGGLRAAGAFLVNGASERPGYGAYTYLLIGSPPSDSAHIVRARAAIARYLQVAQDVASYGANVSPAQLNMNYLPVDTTLSWRRTTVALADSVLAHYQYATAQSLIASLDTTRFHGSPLGGPYLVTVPAPLSTTKPDANRQTVNDLSTITADALVPAWVDMYMTQAMQQRWNDASAWKRFPLVLRTAIGSVALGIPPVKAAMKDWSGWLESWSAASK